jgi:hypothetical protein
MPPLQLTTHCYQHTDVDFYVAIRCKLAGHWQAKLIPQQSLNHHHDLGVTRLDSNNSFPVHDATPSFRCANGSVWSIHSDDVLVSRKTPMSFWSVMR